ncbi:MAG: hypothetical protein BAJATHORv1_40199 [Candidatus Thorarchaeota archaeon]|nr:MAG: hypothetical protein BAJATHORv1_40199 [Candidatus Thorarchaeota archaeon]
MEDEGIYIIYPCFMFAKAYFWGNVSIDMTDFEKHDTIRTILHKIAEKGEKIRITGIYGAPPIEGKVVFVGNDIVAVSTDEDAEPDTYFSLQCIMKIEII